MADPRVYQIEDLKDGTCVAVIIAKTAAQALNHHTKAMFAAKPMSAFDLLQATKHGMPVVDATEDPPEPAEAPSPVPAVNLPPAVAAQMIQNAPAADPSAA